MPPHEPSPVTAMAAIFERYLARWLDSVERARPTPETRAYIAATRANDFRLVPLAPHNVEHAVDVAYDQFRSEPLTLAVGFPDDILRATLTEIIAGCARDDASPSVVLYANGVPCGVGVTTPFEAVLATSPDMPAAVARLFESINESSAAVLATRRRLRNPLDRPLEWLIAAIAPAYRRRLPTEGDHAPTSLFHVVLLTVFELALREGHATMVAHTNDPTARVLMDFGLRSEGTIPYRLLRSRARDDVPGNIVFISGDIARIVASVAD